MRKAGFSLVELSIVILVIGVLIVMIVKGRHLIESVRMKKDVSTIMRLQNALFEYKTTVGDRLLMDNVTHGVIDMRQLEEAGLLNPNDYYSPTSKRYWGLYYCYDENYSTSKYTTGNRDNDSICAGMLGADPFDNISSMPWPVGNAMSLRLICFIESMMDDNEFGGPYGDPSSNWYSTGIGRVGGYQVSSEYWSGLGLTGGVAELTEEKFKNCFLADPTEKMHYLYLIDGTRTR